MGDQWYKSQVWIQYLASLFRIWNYFICSVIWSNALLEVLVIYNTCAFTYRYLDMEMYRWLGKSDSFHSPNGLIVHLRQGKTTKNLECTVIAQSITVTVHKESKAKPQGERYSAIRHMRYWVHTTQTPWSLSFKHTCTHVHTSELFEIYWDRLIGRMSWQAVFLTVNVPKLLFSTFECTLPPDWVSDSYLSFKSHRICIHGFTFK